MEDVLLYATWEDFTIKYTVLGIPQIPPGFNFSKLQRFCNRLEIPCPIEYSTNPSGLGLLYPRMYTLDDYILHKHRDFPQTLPQVIKGLVSSVIRLHDKKFRPWIPSSAFIVVGNGFSGALLQPTIDLPLNEEGEAQDMCLDFSDVASVVENAFKTHTEEICPGLQTVIECMKSADVKMRQRRIMLAPWFHLGSVSDVWGFLGKVYMGQKNNQSYKNVLNTIKVDRWEELFVTKSDRGEVHAIYDRGSAKGESCEALVTFLRHFKQHKGDRKKQLQKSQESFEKYRGDDKKDLRVKDIKKELHSLKLHVSRHEAEALESIVSSGKIVGTGHEDDIEEDRKFLDGLNSHFPHFLNSLFRESYHHSVPGYIEEFDDYPSSSFASASGS